jgi:hypothetical protein
MSDRITYHAVMRLANLKGLGMTRCGKVIEIWIDDVPGVTAVCESVQEAYETVYWYEKGRGL